jgi:hypothetical protein
MASPVLEIIQWIGTLFKDGAISKMVGLKQKAAELLAYAAQKIANNNRLS